MAIPSAVRKIGEQAEQAAVDAGIKPGSQPAPSAGNPPVAAVPDPATEQGGPVEHEDWEKRFKGYKASTDQTIADLRQTLAQMQQTLANSQEQNQLLMSRLEAGTPAKPAESTPTESSDDIDLSILPQSFRDEYDDGFLLNMGKMMNATMVNKLKSLQERLDAIDGNINQVVQTQDKTAVQVYQERLDAAFPNNAWVSMTSEGNKNWAKFCSQSLSEFDSRTYNDIVGAAHEAKDADTVIRVLKTFQAWEQALGGGTESGVNPLAGQVTPEGGGGGDPIDQIDSRTETFTVSQVNQFYKDSATGQYSPEEAAAIEQRIIAAQKAGKIIQG